MSDAAASASPPSPPPPLAMQPRSGFSAPRCPSPPDAADTPASATQTPTPTLPDAPASADPGTPFSDAAPADASDAGAPALAPPDAPADGDDEGGVNASGDGNGLREHEKVGFLPAGKHMPPAPSAPHSKKSKKKGGNNIWTRPSRKGKKKAKKPGNGQSLLGGGATGEEKILLVPAPRLAASRSDNAADLPVLLSRVFKSERVELSDDRLTASSTKGYRMVRATRGVAAGAWYFEIKVVHPGASGHTRLGWATKSSDLQTPVGYDAYGFGYRDIDGAKVHKAWREKYADEGYGEGDVLGFYISLPDGELYEPKHPDVIQYMGVPCRVQVPKDYKMPDPVPGSKICYFKNGVCQGIAFQDIFGGRYHPAASMYAARKEPNCAVKFNLGPEPHCAVKFNFRPDFEYFLQDFCGLPIPQPMSEVPHQAYEAKGEPPVENIVAEKNC